ncbi:hypothetical protein [Methylobacterium nodulans]|uniref:hypothetical protein n=1 Tax=Methylobacterium nodulans TaxID=114616 RepID=UPI0005C1A616|nr:hypothetical protein [Methylobacterium nodulans]
MGLLTTRVVISGVGGGLAVEPHQEFGEALREFAGERLRETASEGGLQPRSQGIGQSIAA